MALRASRGINLFPSTRLFRCEAAFPKRFQRRACLWRRHRQNVRKQRREASSENVLHVEFTPKARRTSFARGASRHEVSGLWLFRTLYRDREATVAEVDCEIASLLPLHG